MPIVFFNCVVTLWLFISYSRFPLFWGVAVGISYWNSRIIENAIGVSLADIERLIVRQIQPLKDAMKAVLQSVIDPWESNLK